MTSKTFRNSVNYKIRNESYKNGKLDYSYGNTTENTFTNTFVGTENPNWRQEVRRGLNATSSMTGVQRDRQPAPVVGSLNYSVPKVRGSDKYTSFLWQDQSFGFDIENPSGFAISSADKLARQRFVSEYRSRRTAFQGGTFLGELAEVVHMIRSPAQSLRDGIGMYYRDVKRRLRRTNRNQSKVVAGTWLEYSFGWAPLIRDVADACKLATADPFAVQQVITGAGSDQWMSNVSRVENSAVGLGQFHWTEFFRSNNTVTVRYRGGIRAENNPPGFPEQLGLSWSNLVPTVWNLIPYSFLVDYFLNVGAVIEGVSTGTIWLSWGAKTVRKEAVGEFSAQLNYAQTKAALGAIQSFSGTASAAGSPGHYKDVTRSKVVSVSYGFSNSDNTFRLPGTNLKWLNIAGLAAMRT